MFYDGLPSWWLGDTREPGPGGLTNNLLLSRLLICKQLESSCSQPPPWYNYHTGSQGSPGPRMDRTMKKPLWYIRVCWRFWNSPVLPCSAANPASPLPSQETSRKAPALLFYVLSTSWRTLVLRHVTLCGAICPFSWDWEPKTAFSVALVSWSVGQTTPAEKPQIMGTWSNRKPGISQCLTQPHPPLKPKGCGLIFLLFLSLPLLCLLIEF